MVQPTANPSATIDNIRIPMVYVYHLWCNLLLIQVQPTANPNRAFPVQRTVQLKGNLILAGD